MTRRLLPATLALVAGCASGGGTPEQTPSVPAAPRAAAQPTDSGPIRLGPSALQYVVTRRIDRVQEFAGQEQRSSLGFSIYVAVTIRGPAVASGYPTTFTIDSITADSGLALPPGVNLDLARGLGYSGVLTPVGDFRGVPSDSTAARALASILGGFRDFYPRLPPAGLVLGAAWIDTITRIEPSGVFDQLTITSIHESRAAAWEAGDAGRMLRIDVAGTVTLAGRGQQAGEPVELDGTGTMNATEFVAADGRYLGGVSRDSTSLAITLRAQGMVVPIRQVTRSSITVLP
ncbi:MAG: hypothetical protein HYS40_03075 [Gemmatimonadetes bacterium]|nr:hypothetical protein [Gemmatimonadota bacterium]